MLIKMDFSRLIELEFHPAIREFLSEKQFTYKEETFFGIGSSLYSGAYLLQGVGSAIWFYKKSFIFKKELPLSLEEWNVLEKVLSDCDRYVRELKREEKRLNF